MNENGFEVYACSSMASEVKEIEKNEGITHFSVPLTRTISPFKDLRALFLLIKLIKKLRPEIIHTHSPKAGIIGMMAAYICRTPLKMHTVAGLPLMETSGIKRKLLIWIEKLTYFFADWVLPNSIEQKNYILENFGKRFKKKIYVVGRGSSNGIDLDYFKLNQKILDDGKKLRSKYSIPSNAIVISFVGRLVPYKGVGELIEAFKSINKVYTNTYLLLIGPFEDMNSLEDKYITEINSNQYITNTGHIEDIRPYLALSDIFIFPSYREGFPQSLMQAAAMGLPCITTNINGCKEIVFNEVNGYLIPPKSVQCIIDKCRILIDNESLRYSMGQSGRGYLESWFDQKKLWNELATFYRKELIKKTPHRF